MCYLKKAVEDTEKVKTPPRSPWRRLISQPLKPKLSRRVIKSAKVNLNRYWTKFEDLSKRQVPLTSIEVGSSSLQQNEINENLANELRESGN